MKSKLAKPEPDYTQAWDDLHQRRLLMVGLLLGFLPGVAFLCFVATTFLRLTRLDTDTICMPIGLLWLGAIAISAWRAGWFRCPQCQQRFCAHRGVQNVFAGHCMNCGIEIGEHSRRPTEA